MEIYYDLGYIILVGGLYVVYKLINRSIRTSIKKSISIQETTTDKLYWNKNYTLNVPQSTIRDESCKEYTNNQNGTRNMFVESYWILGLDYRDELTIQLITDAYERKLNQHILSIKKGDEPELKLDEIKEAKEYLLTIISKRKNHDKE